MTSLFKSIFTKTPEKQPTIGIVSDCVAEEKEAAQQASFQGDLSALPMDDVVQLFEFSRLTGELVVVSPHNKGYFYFQRGLLVFGMLGYSEQKIGELLISENLITDQQLTECLEIQQYQQHHERLGSILIQRGYIQKDNLSESLVKQVKNAFFESLTWKEGRFFFYIDQVPQAEDVVCSERIDHLLLEGMISIDETP